MADEEKAADETSGITLPLPLDTQTTSRKSLLISAAAAVPALQCAVDSNTADIEKLKAQNEARMKDRSLFFSWFAFTLYFMCHIYFFAIGHPLELPQSVHLMCWSMIAGPWLGHATPKLINMLAEKSQEKSK